MSFLEQFVFSAITLFVIMDPFMSLPPFLSLTRKFSEKERIASGDKAIEVAGALAILFLLAGPFLLGALGITISSFKIAGGIVLGFLGLEMVLSLPFSKSEKNIGKKGVAALIGTPLLTGPGLLTALIVLSQQNGVFITLAALLAALAAAWLLLRQATRIINFLGKEILEVLSRVMGLMLVAVAVRFIQIGLLG